MGSPEEDGPGPGARNEKGRPRSPRSDRGERTKHEGVVFVTTAQDEEAMTGAAEICAQAIPGLAEQGVP
jgi:hypothetical protein